MSTEHTLTLRQADAARADFALIESNLEFIAGQLVNQLRGGYAAAAQNCDLHGRLLCLRELTHRA